MTQWFWLKTFESSKGAIERHRLASKLEIPISYKSLVEKRSDSEPLNEPVDRSSNFELIEANSSGRCSAINFDFHFKKETSCLVDYRLAIPAAWTISDLGNFVNLSIPKTVLDEEKRWSERKFLLNATDIVLGFQENVDYEIGK